MQLTLMGTFPRSFRALLGFTHKTKATSRTRSEKVTRRTALLSLERRKRVRATLSQITFPQEVEEMAELHV